MALYLIEGEVLCAAAFCPHLEGPLFEGTLSGATVTCPWHQWRYDLRSGQRIALLGVPLPGDKLARCRVEHDARGAIVLCAPEAT
jgi:nitrite reductase/ring-hydroxylating ferredoxin subunit